MAAQFTDLGEFLLKNIALPVRVLVAGRSVSAPASIAGDQTMLRKLSARDRRRLPCCRSTVAASANSNYIADGIAEDIIHGLSNTRWLSVIAKGSSFQFRDDTLGTQLIGKALGAKYVVARPAYL